MFKKIICSIVIALILIPNAVATAYDEPSFYYYSDEFFVVLNDSSEGWPTWNAELLNFLSSYEGSVFDYFGVGITDGEKYSDTVFGLTLNNQQAEYYLPQLDFLLVSMGEKLSAIDPNYVLEPLMTYSSNAAKTINIPGEVLYYTVPGSDTDKILNSFSETENVDFDFYGAQVKDVTIIAKNEPLSADDGNPLVLYSIKLNKNSDVTPLIMLLNSDAMADNRNDEFHTLIGYSAIQSCYHNEDAVPPETTVKENELIVGVDTGNELYDTLSDLAHSNVSKNTLLGYDVISAKALTYKQSSENEAGYTVFRVKCAADTDIQGLINTLNTQNALAVIRAYETEEVLIGDANEDEIIDNLDAALILKYDAGLIADIDNGDYNGDGVVDNLDATMILKYDAGL